MAQHRSFIAGGVRDGYKAGPRAGAETAPVQVPLRSPRVEPLRSDLPAAVVSHHSRGNTVACTARGRRSLLRSGRMKRATIVELGCGSGEKLMLLAEALQATRRNGARSPDRHFLASARADRAAPQRGCSHFSVVGHRSTYEEGLRRAVAAERRQPDAGAVPRLEYRQLRYAGGSTRSWIGFARRSRLAICCSWARTSSSRSPSCCSPTTILLASPQPSTRTCSSGSTANSAERSTLPNSRTVRSGRPSSSGSRCAW